MHDKIGDKVRASVMSYSTRDTSNFAQLPGQTTRALINGSNERGRRAAARTRRIW